MSVGHESAVIATMLAYCTRQQQHGLSEGRGRHTFESKDETNKSRFSSVHFDYFRMDRLVKMETLMRFFFVAATLVALSLDQGVHRDVRTPVKNIPSSPTTSLPSPRDTYAAGIYQSAYATCGAPAREHALCAPRVHPSWIDGCVTDRTVVGILLRQVGSLQKPPSPVAPRPASPASSVLSTCTHIYLGTARWQGCMWRCCIVVSPIIPNIS